MSMTLTIYIDNETEMRLRSVCAERHESERELCSNIVSEALLDHFRNSKVDPAKGYSK